MAIFVHDGTFERPGLTFCCALVRALKWMKQYFIFIFRFFVAACGFSGAGVRGSFFLFFCFCFCA